jgi:outer membrane lipoprotein SlyB
VVQAATPAAPPPCHDCGTVDNVREVKQEGTGSGIGAVAGGLLGGILGHQVGQGSGNKLATVLGAVGGAYAGHQVEKSRNQSTRYEIAVRMDDGSRRTVTQDSQPNWRIGERVRVDNGVVAPLGQEAGMPPAPTPN